MGNNNLFTLFVVAIVVAMIVFYWNKYMKNSNASKQEVFNKTASVLAYGTTGSPVAILSPIKTK